MEYYFYKKDIEFIMLENETVSYQEHNHSTMYVMGIVLAGNVDVCMREIECSYTKNQYFSILCDSQRVRSIDNLAKQVCFSKEYFIRRFKKDIGMPPHHYVLQNRIRYAQKLLQQDIPIVDVAVETGFYDQSHFLKAFRQIVGITPKEYKSVVHVLA